MRPLIPLSTLAATLLIALPASAQQKPADLQPLPDVPPPPPMVDNVPDPQVTIVKRGEDTVEEYRVNGRLYMMKVTPPHGKPYFLIDDQGNGKWARREAGESGLSVPMWVIKTF